MKELQQLYSEAARFKTRRNSLATALKNVDVQHRERVQKAEKEHQSRIRNLEDERKAALNTYESRAKKEIANYTQIKNSLRSFVEPVKHWCPDDALRGYQPSAARVDESELNRLIQMVQEQGIMAWIKRTFKLDGYSSRGEMALSLCQKVEDACVYCNEKIDAAESACVRARQDQMTQTRRKQQALEEQYVQTRKNLEDIQKQERSKALAAIQSFDASSELRDMHNRIERLYLEGENACGAWGEYVAPARMPEQVLLCNVGISLPDSNGIDQQRMLPLWLDLYKSNLLVP